MSDVETAAGGVRVGIVPAADGKRRVQVCAGTACVFAGSLKIFEAFEREIAAAGLADQVEVAIIGCHGLCSQGPLAVISGQETYYPKLKAKHVERIVKEHLVGGTIVDDLLYVEPGSGERIACWHDIPFYAQQTRIALRDVGVIHPERIEEYVARGGYAAARTVVTEKTPEWVIDEVLASGIRGRGGAGFPTGQKWKFAYSSVSDQKYLICNGDEGDPGAFMDRLDHGRRPARRDRGHDHRLVCDRRPRRLHLRARRVPAGRQAPASGDRPGRAARLSRRRHVRLRLELSSEDQGGRRRLRLRRRDGPHGQHRRPSRHAALAAAVPGRVGPLGQAHQHQQRRDLRQHSLDHHPRGAAYAALGTEKSKGTKAFALAGKLVNGGLAEVPIGSTIREMVYGVGGGIKDGRQFKAVQLGGPSGGCVPAALIDTPIDYESLAATGAIMGSGGMVVADDQTCMVDLARFFLQFTQNESCGKCVPCRIGTKRMLEILEAITAGQGEDGDIERLQKLAATIKRTSLCGLGQTAPNPVLTTIRYFRDEYEAHIYDGACPARACSALITYHIDPESCTGCMLCAKKCPVGAISGERKQTHVIDIEVCTKCDTCRQVCRFGAVERLTGDEVAAVSVAARRPA
jgi:NADH:ubiquinone oxidoreductase subunit F (NADH-binding)/(2Fe-2S) ferredoxin/Pyruvate/2-oxoacid:ferredoxin oxidoreductase delta subunit